MLCFISVLFMAMPISVSGQAFRVAAVPACAVSISADV